MDIPGLELSSKNLILKDTTLFTWLSENKAKKVKVVEAKSAESLSKFLSTCEEMEDGEGKGIQIV